MTGYRWCGLVLALLLLLGCGGGWGEAAAPPKPEPLKPVFRFAQLADVHFTEDGPDGGWRLLADSPALLEDALQQINALGGVQCILFSGDFVNTPQALPAFFKVLKAHNRLPVYFALGRSDVGTAPEQKKRHVIAAIQALGGKGFPLQHDAAAGGGRKGYYTFHPSATLAFIVLDATVDSRQTGNGALPPEELEWLKKELVRLKDKTVFVALHFPLVHSETLPSQAIAEADRARLLSVLEAAPNVSAVFSGHYHMARIQRRNGILHFAAPPLVEFPNAFRVFTLYSNGTLRAEWFPTRREDLREKSRSRSPWVEEADGNPAVDHETLAPLRFYPAPLPGGRLAR